MEQEIRELINCEIKRFLDAVSSKFCILGLTEKSLDVHIKTAKIHKTTKERITKTKEAKKPPVKKNTKNVKSIFKFIEEKTVKYTCKPYDDLHVLFQNFIIHTKTNCVVGKLTEKGKQKLEINDFEIIKEYGFNYRIEI